MMDTEPMNPFLFQSMLRAGAASSAAKGFGMQAMRFLQGKGLNRTVVLPLGCAAALCGMPAELFAAEPGGMKMYVYEEQNNDRALMVTTFGAGGSRKNLQMVVFDGGAVAAEPDDKGIRLGIPAGGSVPVVLESYPQRQVRASGLRVNTYGELGYRHDQLKWNIAAPSGRPNVLSELQWNNVRSVTVTGGTEITFDNWLAEGKLSYGQIVSGDNQDSDYLLDNRRGEFSRSNNASDDGMAIDLSAGLGYNLKLAGDKKRFYWQVTPKVGYAFHTQQFNMTRGFQIIPAAGAFGGLDSTYESAWYGPWGGLSTQIGFDRRFSLEAGAAYHWIDYEGTGHWNLREDFQQPKSFTHQAEGGGITASMVARYFLTPEWILRFTAEFQYWLANNDGVDKTFFADGFVGETRFNEVKWKSYGFNLGFEYLF
jgi:hypothetical protein